MVLGLKTKTRKSQIIFILGVYEAQMHVDLVFYDYIKNLSVKTDIKQKGDSLINLEEPKFYKRQTLVT